MQVIFVIVAIIVLLIVIALKQGSNIKKEIEVQKVKADQGDIQAMFEISKLYNRYDSSDESYEEAISWCKKAADQNHIEAKAFLQELIAEAQRKKLNISQKKEAKSAKHLKYLIERWGPLVKSHDSIGRTCSQCRYGKSGLNYCDESGRDEDDRSLKQALGSYTCQSFQTR